MRAEEISLILILNWLIILKANFLSLESLKSLKNFQMQIISHSLLINEREFQTNLTYLIKLNLKKKQIQKITKFKLIMQDRSNQVNQIDNLYFKKVMKKIRKYMKFMVKI